jgi:hypothetical protein
MQSEHGDHCNSPSYIPITPRLRDDCPASYSCPPSYLNHFGLFSQARDMAGQWHNAVLYDGVGSAPNSKDLI